MLTSPRKNFNVLSGSRKQCEAKQNKTITPLFPILVSIFRLVNHMRSRRLNTRSRRLEKTTWTLIIQRENERLKDEVLFLVEFLLS